MGFSFQLYFDARMSDKSPDHGLHCGFYSFVAPWNLIWNNFFFYDKFETIFSFAPDAYDLVNENDDFFKL